MQPVAKNNAKAMDLISITTIGGMTGNVGEHTA